ncbi:hypothetical protein E8E14_008485 [Neopestalotiopsis sp. 37M]|nr:hypothetical protein E8E14_008485 [Neopestalotiopsis sp. 37M]
MDLSNNLKILSIERLEKISIADLQARIDQKLNISLSKQQAFETYMGWLREQLAMDMFVQEDPILKAWAISLLERGFGKDFILSSFRQWQQQEALVDRSTLRRFLMVEEELSDFLEHPSGGQSRKRKQSPPSDKENDELHFRKGKRQTGANETPVGERRPLGSSWLHHEISKTRSSGLHHLPSRPDHENRPLSSISPTPGKIGPSCVAGKKRSNSGIIDIGTPTKKMSRDRHLDDDTPLQAPYPKNNNPGPNIDTLDSIPPHEGYVCNRCGKKGHWIGEKRMTLINGIEERSDHTLLSVEMPETLQMNAFHVHRDRSVHGVPLSVSVLGIREVENATSRSRIWREDLILEGVTKESQRTHLGAVDRDRAHPATKDRTDAVFTLRYEGDDETDAGSTKQPGDRFASKTPQTPSTSIRMGSTTPSSIEVLTRFHTLSTQEAFTSEAIAEVDTFLRNLDNESLEDRVEGACEQEMTSMIEEICGDEDPLLYQDDDGVLCKRVTNPPYSDQVVRLFTHRSNPIIRARTERALASEFWKTQSKFEDMSLDDLGASN